ncbi:MAG: PIG-L deacetylase family protein [Bacteroidota bacterium]|jgi:LmbE family N-acetylglucosaminyl deacetylase
MLKEGNVLILAPHTDDGELGCGGTIARLLEEGNNVFYLAFSICEESVPEGFPKNALETEVKKATAHLGIPANNLILKKYPVRKFKSFRQEILEDLVQIRGIINPSSIFMPSSRSLHQDHQTIYEEGMRAFKHFTCYGYDLPWDTINFSTTAFYKLEERHIQKKCEALEFYETQNYRTYCDADFIRGLARVRGAQIAVKYAESFELLRSVK